MAKELTDKVKEEIVEAQISIIKKYAKSGRMNYESLRGYLNEGIDKYVNENSGLNENVDYNLMKKIENELGGKNFARLTGAIRIFGKVELKNPLKNKDFLEFYNEMEDELNSRGGIYSLRNYGKRSHKLLRAYLERKGFI